MQRSLWSHCAGRARCQSHLLKINQMDSEAYLQEMQKDGDKKQHCSIKVVRLHEHLMICLMLTT